MNFLSGLVIGLVIGMLIGLIIAAVFVAGSDDKNYYDDGWDTK